MDQFMENPLVAASRGMGAVSRRGWDVKEEKDALFVRMDMPGLGKEDVKVSVEQNTLIIKGEGGKESENDETGRKYTSRIDLPANLYKFDEIKAEMKNGVLKVVVPKVKEDGKKDAFQVNINWGWTLLQIFELEFPLCLWLTPNSKFNPYLSQACFQSSRK